MQILKIIIDNPSVSNAHYSFSEEELLVNFYAAGGPSSSSTSPLSWKSFAQEVTHFVSSFNDEVIHTFTI